MSKKGSLKIFTGTANPWLAQSVVDCLGVELGRATVGRFSDGEVVVEVCENVRGHDVFILQSTSYPTNDTLMEVVILADALLRASAGRITAAIPYLGYSRQDRRPRSARVPISSKVVANMLTCAGINRVLTVDLHADQIQGFFDIPVDNIYATPVILDDMRSRTVDDTIVVAPDVGSVLRARAFAKLLSCDLAIIDKRRTEYNKADVMNVIGDVHGRSCIIIDDMVDTAQTLCRGTSELKNRGAKRILAYCSHAVLSGNAIDTITNSCLDELVVTDTIPLREDAKRCTKIKQISIAKLLAQAIARIHAEESVSTLFSS
ncbi:MULTISPECIES: ribose-phosphate pyrophosphokinase [Candidatus Ichthyocystis]|uniref:Ribose-phosphate pyrophosphokinase n=1 Tax=Candidatus Ichthyocystis hellenicum TaxID=1561003 RepID=A0A0S4M211_9BURK|nr:MULTISPECIES: ribose-phosphate pyrophosphokinase [Ichthyocystis]CUT17055.1 Ribose-phosphate pyrophosphokinase [Candidatus Ichthyocystis hellenicum]